MYLLQIFQQIVILLLVIKSLFDVQFIFYIKKKNKFKCLNIYIYLSIMFFIFLTYIYFIGQGS